MRMLGVLTSHWSGPGGRDCACCGEPPGKDRVKAKRVMKRRERQKWRKQIEKEQR